MKTFRSVGLCVSGLSLLFSACAHAVDVKQIERELTTTGAVGWVHGSSPTQGLFVFTYRNPNDFFDYLTMSLVAEKPEILKQLEVLNRHDKVKIHGSFMDNPSPQKHVTVSAVEMVKKFESPHAAGPYQHEARVPDELLNKTSGLFLVHAIGEDGHILVLEYKDTVVPVFVKNTALTKNLYRGDLVKLNFTMQTNPDRPTHLKLAESQPDALQVVDGVKAKHGKPAQVEGALVFFPKSPEIVFNIFAVLEPLPEGLTRQYTIVNFDSQDAFAKVRAKLQAAWDKYPGAYTNGRNKLLSTRVRVKVTGTFNEVDPNQANPQVLVKSADDIEVIDK